MTRIRFLLLAVLAVAGLAFVELGRGGSRVIDGRAPARLALPPVRPGAPCVRLLALGDVGEGNRGQRRVADALERRARARGADAVLLLGDLFYDEGVTSTDDPQWTSKFRDVYTGALRSVAFRPALGNHDHRGEPAAYVAYGAVDRRWSMPALYYAFHPAPGDPDLLEVFVLDTTPLVRAPDAAEEQLAWLSDALERSSSTWKLVAGHHPIDSGGTHGPTPALRERLLPLLQRFEVALYLSGHDHHQALMQLPGGTLQVISGAGSKTRDVVWTESTLFASAELGFVALRVSSEALVLEYFDADGGRLYAYPVLPMVVVGESSR